MEMVHAPLFHLVERIFLKLSFHPTALSLGLTHVCGCFSTRFPLLSRNMCGARKLNKYLSVLHVS